MLLSKWSALDRFLVRFGPAIILSAVLVVAIVGATAAVRLTHRPALAAQPVDPAISAGPLHGSLQRSRDVMALP
jgi:hypothetical protein